MEQVKYEAIKAVLSDLTKEELASVLNEFKKERNEIDKVIEAFPKKFDWCIFKIDGLKTQIRQAIYERFVSWAKAQRPQCSEAIEKNTKVFNPIRKPWGEYLNEVCQ